jgi:hypothetical protein
VLGTALVLLYAGPQTWAGRLLALRPLVAVGLASYSAYLWHQPLFAFTHVALDRDPSWSIMLVLSALAVGFGFASLHLVEAPFRRSGQIDSGRVVMASGGILALIAAGGLAIYLSHGLPGRPAASHLPRDYYVAVAAPIFPVYGRDMRDCRDLCTVNAPPAPTRRVLLAGDSHAQDLIPAMTELARARNWELVLLVDKGCSFTALSPLCADSRATLIAQANSFDEVVISIRLSARPELRDHPDPDDAIAAALLDYGDLIALITQQGTALTLLSPRPVLNTDPVRAALADRVGEITIATDIASTAAWKAVLERLSGGPNIRVVDQSAILMTSAGCDTTSCFHAHDQDMLPLYRDLHHLSPHAAQKIVDAVATLPR